MCVREPGQDVAGLKEKERVQGCVYTEPRKKSVEKRENILFFVFLLCFFFFFLLCKGESGKERTNSEDKNRREFFFSFWKRRLTWNDVKNR